MSNFKQYLLLPFTKSMMLCGYKNKQYLNYWKYPHYGIDISTIQGKAGDDHNVYSSGEGTVLKAGKDNNLGYGLCVLYDNCIIENEVCKPLILRYMHLKEIFVKTGDKVTVNTKLGVEGKEGTTDYHLHLEVDTDTKFPNFTPQVSQGHTFWKKGTDSTLDPSLVLYQSEGRTLVDPTYNPAWLNVQDFKIPIVKIYKLLDYTKEEIDIYEQIIKQTVNSLQECIDKLNKFIQK